MKKIIHFNYKKIEEKEVTKFGSTKTSIRVLISENKSPNFIMRRFEIKPNGKIGLHNHPWEHEMFILKGEMFLIDKKGKKERITKDDFVFVPENEPHGYINEGKETVAFICIIPKIKN